MAEMPLSAIRKSAFNEVARTSAHGVADTGAINIVSSIILDYRPDTLGEATVLLYIAAVIAA